MPHTAPIDLDIHVYRTTRRSVVAPGNFISRAQVASVLDAIQIAIPGLETGFAASRKQVVWIVAGLIQPTDARSIGRLLSAAMITDDRPERTPRYVHSSGLAGARDLLAHFAREEEPGAARDRLEELRRSRSASEAAGTLGPLIGQLYRTVGTVVRWLHSNTAIGVGSIGDPDVVRVRQAASPTIHRLVEREAEWYATWLADDAHEVLRVHLGQEIEALTALGQPEPQDDDESLTRFIEQFRESDATDSSQEEAGGRSGSHRTDATGAGDESALVERLGTEEGTS